MEVTLILCDWAEAVNGKLYILGGGWSRMAANVPMNMALGIKVAVPWEQANRQIPIRARLITEDGHPVSLGDPAQEIKIEGGVEVGRPPGLKPGTDLDAVLALRFPGIVLPPGGYSWVFEVGDKEEARVPFEAAAVLPGGGFPQ